MAPGVKPGQRWLVDDGKRKFIVEVLPSGQSKVVQYYSGEYHVGFMGTWALNCDSRFFTLLEGQEAPTEK